MVLKGTDGMSSVYDETKRASMKNGGDSGLDYIKEPNSNRENWVGMLGQGSDLLKVCSGA